MSTIFRNFSPNFLYYVPLFLNMLGNLRKGFSHFKHCLRKHSFPIAQTSFPQSQTNTPPTTYRPPTGGGAIYRPLCKLPYRRRCSRRAKMCSLVHTVPSRQRFYVNMDRDKARLFAEFCQRRQGNLNFS